MIAPLDPITLPLQGTHLIEASAGTGKTWTICALVLRLVVQAGIPIDQILVVTFTTAATADLRARVLARLQEAESALVTSCYSDDPLLESVIGQHPEPELALRRLRLALADFDTAGISTIHSFCQRVLRELAFECGVPLGLELLEEEGALRREVALDAWTRSQLQASPSLLRAQQASKTDPDRYVNLVSQAADHPDLIVIPDPPPIDTDRIERERQRAQAEARLHFDGPALLRLLTDGSLNGTTYKPDQIPVWIEQTRRFLDGAGPPPEKLANLSQQVISSKAKKGRTAPRHPFFAAIDALSEALDLQRQADDILRIREERAVIEQGRAALVARKAERRVQSFGDLLHALRDALHHGPDPEGLRRALRQRYQAVMVDEFQDTDPVQYAIFHQVWHGQEAAGLYLIGDPKQSIYAFRGADIQAYLRAARSADRRWSLDVNRRSDPGLIEAMNGLFLSKSNPFLSPDIPYPPVKPRPNAADVARDADGQPLPGLELVLLRREGLALTAKGDLIKKESAEQALLERVAHDVAAMLTQGETLDGEPVKPGQIAVLTRKNKQALAVQAALRARGVPSVIANQGNVFDSPEAHDVQRLVTALAEPRSQRAIAAALGTALVSDEAGALYDRRTDESLREADLDRFVSFRQQWDRHGFLVAFRAALDSLGVAPRLLRRVGGERSLTNVLHLAELLHAESLRGRHGPEGLCRWLFTQRCGDRLQRADTAAAEIRLESDDKAVQVVTAHKSKGLEYPVIFCPFLLDPVELHPADKKLLLFADPNRDHQAVLDLGSSELEQNQEHKREALLAEERRLLYVALTRPRHRAIVYVAAVNNARKSALAWLLGVEDAIAAPDDGALSAALRGLTRRLPVALREEAAQTPPLFYQARAEDGPPLAPAPRARVLRDNWRASSFSGLVREGDPGGLEGGADHDETVRPSPGGRSGDPVPLDSFDRGPRAGTLLHAIFEEANFQAAEPEALAEPVTAALRRFGLPTEAWTAPLSSALWGVLQCPLEAGGPRLADLGPADKIVEMEFLFPVAQQGEGFTPGHLAGVFEAHARAPVPRAYAAELRRMGFVPLQGWMRGFIDLVFHHQGRFYVVDYKSNHLGGTWGDYHSEAIRDAMVHHHYILQYHLYVAALHRYLALRVADYDYETHMGGVYYLFLRGMSPDNAPGHGVWQDRPSLALITALSAELEQSELIA